MSERRIIEDRLKKKQAEIHTLEEKLKAAKIYMAALRDIVRDLEKTDGVGDRDEDGDAKLRAGSATAQARELILRQREPMHIDDILEAMGKVVTRDTKASLAGSLAAYVRKGEIFTRPAPNTYGLVELGHDETEDKLEEQPPTGFGGSNVGLASRYDDIEDDIPF